MNLEWKPSILNTNINSFIVVHRITSMQKPIRQVLGAMMQRYTPVLPRRIEDQYLRLIDFVLGKEPHFFIHYGKDCVCCARGWHK